MTEAAKQNRMEILDRWQELITRCGFTVLIDEDGVFVSENTGNGRTARFPDGISALSALHLEVIENILGDLAQKTREAKDAEEYGNEMERRWDEGEKAITALMLIIKSLEAQVEQLGRQVAEMEKIKSFIESLREGVFAGSIKGITGRQQREGDEALQLIENALASRARTK